MRYPDVTKIKKILLMLAKPGLILTGILLTLYPWISNTLYERSASSKVGTYREAAENMEEGVRRRIWEEAVQYNRDLSTSQAVLTDPFYKELDIKSKRYEDVLNVDAAGVMATVEIPCIGVELPVYHGTSSAVLERGAGHLEGSSLPVGGEDTHAVLTGHTGLSSAKLFTDLAEMEKGDLFYIHVLGKILAYRVDQILVVVPEDTKDLNIVYGKDYVSLVTCTPYGINSHRLLVRGERTEYREEERMEAGRHRRGQSQWMREYRRALLAGLVLVGGGEILVYILRRRKERE